MGDGRSIYNDNVAILLSNESYCLLIEDFGHSVRSLQSKWSETRGCSLLSSGPNKLPYRISKRMMKNDAICQETNVSCKLAILLSYQS